MSTILRVKNKINKVATLVLLVFVAACTATESQVPLAFDGAQGFGKYTQGGRGGTIYVVNSLEDDGKDPQPGTLRHGLKQEGPRIIVFSVSGVIHLSKPLEIKQGDLTIAGQSSPGGIVVAGAQTDIEADNVIIRYVHFRPGKDQGEGDALTARRRSNIIIDHCSLSWANDEVASFYNNQNFTLQYSMITESLNNAGHHKGSHGYGGIWGGSKASFIHNVVAHHHSRNPRVNGYRLNAPYQQIDELTDIRNNVFYNWRDNSGYGGEGGRFNLVANYYKPGPSTKPMRFFQLWSDEKLPPTEAYIANNVMAGESEMSEDNLAGIKIKNDKKLTREEHNAVLASSLYPTPFGIGDIVPSQPRLSAEQAYDIAINQREVGANRNANGLFVDSVDARLLHEIATGTVHIKDGIIDSELEVISSWSDYEAQFKAFPSVALPEQSHIEQWLDKLGQF